jgi:5'-nucleotidase
MKRRLPLILFLSLVSALACTTATLPPAAPAPSGPVHVVIVGTTDVHGWFAGHDESNGETNPKMHTGGLAVFASYVDALRAANPGRVIVVDSGDMFQGTLESNLFEGEPVVEGYNAIGYTAAAVGNHEFDYGPVGPDPVARTPDQDPLGALKRNSAHAKYPLLSANMTEKATGTQPAWAHPWVMVNAGGAKIGIIGLSTPDTPNVTTEQNVRSLNFADPVPVTISAARALRAQGADAVIVIAHMGGRCKVIDTDPHDVSSCEVNQEAMRFLAALPPDLIDAYFAGHTHSSMRQIISGVPALQAQPFSREFSTLDLWVDPQTHHVLTDKTVLRPMTQICEQVWSGTVSCDTREAKKGLPLVPRTFEGRAIAADPKLTALFQPYLAKVAAKRNEPTGIHTAARVKRAYSHESVLGNLLTDALRAATGADMAFINSGGIRADLRAGDLLYSDIFEISPFDNFPATVELTGAQIEEMLRITSSGDRGLLQASGLKYTIDAAKDMDKRGTERNRLTQVMLANGAPLEREKLYKVALPDFLATGGDGLMPVMKDVPPSRVHIRLDMGTLREVFIPALRAFPQPLDPKLEGRIVVLNDKGADD